MEVLEAIVVGMNQRSWVLPFAWDLTIIEEVHQPKRVLDFLNLILLNLLLLLLMFSLTLLVIHRTFLMLDKVLLLVSNPTMLRIEAGEETTISEARTVRILTIITIVVAIIAIPTITITSTMITTISLQVQMLMVVRRRRSVAPTLSD